MSDEWCWTAREDLGGIVFPKAETYTCPKRHLWKGLCSFEIHVDGQRWQTGPICPRCTTDFLRANFPATLVEVTMSESNAPVESELPSEDVPMEEPVTVPEAPVPALGEKPPEKAPTP